LTELLTYYVEHNNMRFSKTKQVLQLPPPDLGKPQTLERWQPPEQRPARVPPSGKQGMLPPATWCTLQAVK